MYDLNQFRTRRRLLHAHFYHGKLCTSGFQDRADRLSQTEDTRNLKIIVIGAGISGLGVAIAASLSGHQVDVLEAAPQLAEVRPFRYCCNVSDNRNRWELDCK